MNLRTIPVPGAGLQNELPNRIDVALLETLFEPVDDVAFFVKDREGRYLAVNSSLVRRHGLQAKESVIGKRPSDICEGEFGRIPAQQDRQVLTTGRPMVDHLEMQWHQPHQPVWCFTTKLPVRDALGQVQGLVGTSRDVRAPVGPEEIPIAFAKAIQEFPTDCSGKDGVAALARMSGLTTSRLAKLTRRLFGLTPNQWITKHRISMASRLLLEQQLTISEVAQQCGYYDHSAFTRAFRKATGLTPTQFRSQSPTPPTGGLLGIMRTVAVGKS